MRSMCVLHVFIVLGLLAGIACSASPSEADDSVARIAATGPKVVTGLVYTSGGSTPAIGATVIATVWDGSTFRASQSETTDSSGFYSITFGPSDWDVGNNIVVGATLGSDVGGGEVIADDSYSQTVNISLGTVVSEFGAPAVLLAAGIVAGALVVGRKRKV